MNQTQPTATVPVSKQLDAMLTAALPPRSNAPALLGLYKLELWHDCGGHDLTTAEALAMLNEPEGMAALIRVATHFHKVMTQ
ncbi:hypothetical protein [Hydrogenophaga taeniospiralis]|uniref:hypothetical protein n=1 Tax=Hydrogenophaga taeniospiralis TaxID=65656 RepID=UPI001CFA29A1|nr:hypothetical protein [Hydrogenophaga taeniospiralis]UCU95803.1 hypothetical protein KI616_08160 [Hydrogenophaga taeniospiralis]